MKASVLIWDSEDLTPDKRTEHTLLWRSYGEGVDSSTFSIPKLVEDSALELRSRYLAWIYELGERQYRDKRIVEHLQLRPNLSYWWMTLLVEKCNFAKSPQIDDAIRLLALEKWLRGRETDCVKLVSANINLATVIKKWCHANGVKFEWRKTDEKLEQPKSLGYVAFSTLPFSLQALIWLLNKVWVIWPLRGAGVNAWRDSTAKATFITYFDNLVPQAALAGRFESRYWAHLPKRLKQNSIKTRWLHLWAKDSVAPTAKRARQLIEQFNQNESVAQVHVTLESFISLKLIWGTLKNWSMILRLGKFLEKTLEQGDAGVKFDLWPFVRGDWRNSFYGPAAARNLLMLNLFDAALGNIPTQRVGTYLQENIGWEFGLIAAWRKLGHGRLIGTVHSLIRFWDLRYHFDPRSYVRKDKLGLPWPDFVAVNGRVAKAQLRESGCVSEQLADVEALRYFHLLNNDNRKLHTVCNERRRLLVIGDYVEKNTAAQMSLLERCVATTKISIDIIVKPHPNCPIKLEDYPRIDFIVTNEHLGTLLDHCDVAYTSSVTSGGVDAYCVGVPVISVLDQKSLNLSPLRGLPHVDFITTAEELGHAISAAAVRGSVANQKVDYFNLDPSLTMWIKLLCERDKLALGSNDFVKR